VFHESSRASRPAARRRPPNSAAIVRRGPLASASAFVLADETAGSGFFAGGELKGILAWLLGTQS